MATGSLYHTGKCAAAGDPARAATANRSNAYQKKDQGLNYFEQGWQTFMNGTGTGTKRTLPAQTSELQGKSVFSAMDLPGMNIFWER
jgi:hypothetical protein